MTRMAANKKNSKLPTNLSMKSLDTEIAEKVEVHRRRLCCSAQGPLAEGETAA